MLFFLPIRVYFLPILARFVGVFSVLWILTACMTTVSIPELTVEAPSPQASSKTLPNSSATWVAQPWSALPEWNNDNLDEAWLAWIESCRRPKPVWLALCPEVLNLRSAHSQDKRSWIQSRLQPYQLLNPNGNNVGKLTSYYEPLFEASVLPSSEFAYPLFSPPPGLRKPWLERRHIDSETNVPMELKGRDWAYLRSPVDVLNLHIQGSGKLQLRQPNGSIVEVRAAFADTNGHPFRSPFQWLIQNNELRNPNWQTVQAWVERNPAHRVRAMLNSNPRYIFFRQEAVASQNPLEGPKGAEGVPLTAGRSIAVDPQSIPYGTPVWISSRGSNTTLNRLVLAQDTGSAIVGAIRADYFAGTGHAAGEFAQRINQPLQVWALWPK